jgi:MscS family membrane protein
MVWFQTADWGEFIQIRQELLLQLMEVVERAGTALAYPTQTLHVLPDTPLRDALDEVG